MNDDIFTAESVSAIAAGVAGQMLEAFRENLSQGLSRVPAKEVKEGFYTRVLKTLMEGLEREVQPPRTEDIALEIIRQGIPSKDVMAGHRHLDVRLAHATFRLFRMTGTGTFRMMEPEVSGNVRTAIGQKRMVEYLLAVDAQIPMLEKLVAATLREMEEAFLRKQAEDKAEEIERLTLECQLNEVLPGLDVNCTYEVRDGKVRLELSKTLKGVLDIPMEDLPTLLADPERLLAALSPDKARPCTPVRETVPPRGFRFSRHGII